uniref:Uncharacterized protein n=1 Tax=Human herpesvirus 2 TaxID=10310 RepID=A0A2U9DVM0_HHV2|nr:hypothetical protein [Human alphaherpesvirus 2]QBH75690.1 hypothetical protein [Human alphaherpesvirus 2]QBH75862.1 hypothetical protein [Human alphaherpesvirus 2]QBH77223.1 hypothetical protein [Human alphaherpesvirus 2]QBH79140.1 hypothetical protein [Human alphaherpesvirus 2]
MSNRNKGVETDCWVSGVIITQGRGWRLGKGKEHPKPEKRTKRETRPTDKSSADQNPEMHNNKRFYYSYY